MTQRAKGALTPGADLGQDEMLHETRPLMRGLGALLEKTEFAWFLALTGEDHAGKLATLTSDLRRPVSMTGNGKRITSGFLYLGAEPAIAWTKTCRDPLNPVMKQSIESFDRRWRSVKASLERKSYQYVSLGPGDGQKDVVILQDLKCDNARLCYVAVDMSTEMLRLGGRALTHQLRLSRPNILPVQLDFSSEKNVVELRRSLNELFGEEAVLFSLLGNTMANFENDTELLRMLAKQLLRPQDRLVLEVATTQKLDATLAQEAAEEYGDSRTFREFATSALMHYTDLHIEMDSDSLLFQGCVEEERSLLIKTIYQNRTDREIRITLPDRTSVSFPQEDTVRLCLSRKYAQHHLNALLAESGVHKVDSSHFGMDGTTHTDLRFGMDLLVLAADSEIMETAQQERVMAAEIWAGEDSACHGHRSSR